MYTFTMKKYQENLKVFIERIKKKEIIENEVVIGELSQPIVKKLQQYNLIVETTEIYLSVNAYNHQLRTFKQKKGKTVPMNLVEEFFLMLKIEIELYFFILTNEKSFSLK